MVIRLFRHACVLFSILALVAVATESTSYAAKKKPKKPKKPKNNPAVQIDPSDVFTVDASIKVGKKKKTFTISCLDNTPGKTKTTSKGMTFTSYVNLIKQLKKKHGNPALMGQYASLNKAGRSGCLEPDFLSLSPYKGKFGVEEARTLYDRFAFGYRPEQAAAAANAGLARAVDQLTTGVAEPGMDGMELELRCDGYLASDTRNESADPKKCPPGNRNAVRFSGVRFDIYNRILDGQNPFFERFFFFLHDERMTAGSRVLDSTESYALIDHVHLLRRAAFTGNYVQFLRDWNNDYLGHLIWLDGASNDGRAPNENYAREFWELGTVGPTGLDGKAVYSDLDIAQSALAFSGWQQITATEKDAAGKDYYVSYGARAPLRHASGGKRIFIGTPYERTVDNDEDVLQATLAHPRLAEHLAEDIWKEFINPFATPSAIKRLAKLIRDNNYQLIPVFKIVMKSQAVFAPRSYKSIVKHPMELAFGFIKQTGIPVLDSVSSNAQTGLRTTNRNYFEQLEDNVLSDTGEVPTQPNTVFGWNEKQLAGESYVLPWRNSLTWILNQSQQEMQLQRGFTMRARFFNGLPGVGAAADALIDRLSGDMNVRLNQKQRAHLLQFLNYAYEQCSNNDKKDPAKMCNERGYRAVSAPFDPDPTVENKQMGRLLGAIQILAELPNYRMK